MPERAPLPPGWPPPERIAAIMEAIRRQIEARLAEMEAREPTANEPC